MKKSAISDMCHRKTYMYINFNQTRVSRSVKTVHTNLFAKKGKLHKLVTTNSNFEKNNFLNMHHHKTYMYTNFQQNQVNRTVIIVHTNIFAKIAICINLQLPILFLKKSTLSDMHHRKMYMYLNFQRNRVSRSVKTVHTYLFAFFF